MAVFLAALDMTIVTTALPTISAYFQTSEADYTWVGSAYLLAAAAATPTWGKVSDIFGRKPILLFANIVFFVGSLICGLSVNVHMLIAGRVIQGLGGGGLIILVNICISDLFSMRSRGMYFGIIGMVWAFASGVGPVLGGVFVSLSHENQEKIRTLTCISRPKK
jgi:MFS family permease